MPKNTSGPLQKTAIRQKAEKLHSERPRKEQALDPASLIHEFEVHQIELEMQNEELRKAQREIEEARERYIGLYDFAPVAYLTLDEKGLISELNLAASELLGIKRKNLVNKPFHPFIKTESQDAFYFHRQEVLVSSTKQTCELVLKKNDCTFFYARLDSIGAEVDGHRIMRIILTDITERKQEETLRQSERRERERAQEAINRNQKTFFELVERAPFGIYVVNSLFRIEQMNAGSQTGAFRNVRPLIGRDFTEVVHIIWPEPVATEIVALFRHTLETGEPYYSSRFVNPRHDVEVVEAYEWELHRLTLPDGQYGVICYYFDSTNLRNAEEALRKAHDELEARVQERTFELSEAYETLQKEVDERKKAEDLLVRIQKLEGLGTLAGGIAHDFNNILTGIIGFTEMVLEDINPDGPEYKRLGLALKGAHRGRDLVKQILTFSRQTTLDRKPLALTQVVEEGLKLLRPTLPSTIEIVSTNTVDNDTILADSSQMHQILMNLCINAAHAMREKGGVLNISISEASLSESDPKPIPAMRPGKYVVLQVRDTGCGMGPEVLKRIFDPFFTTKAQGEGTGLGLSVAHGIIKIHDGYVTVESEPGKGTVFHVYLPSIKKQKLPGDEDQHTVIGGKERILFVDDEDILIELNKQRLSRLGYDIVGTTSSTDALDLFRKEPDTFDLVITDHTMPNLTGMDLAAKLLKIRATIPIILCTGHNESVSAARANQIGIKVFLMKPVGKQELAQAIRRVLDEKT